MAYNSFTVENTGPTSIWVKCDAEKPDFKSTAEAAQILGTDTWFMHPTAGYTFVRPGKTFAFHFDESVSIVYVTAVRGNKEVICSLLPRYVSCSINVGPQGVVE